LTFRQGPETRQVVLPLAHSLPSLSKSLPAANAARRPTDPILPLARTGPLAQFKA